MSAVIIGQPYNIEVVKEVYNWIVPQIENLASEACRNYNGYSRIPTFRRSFYEGITVRIDQRLRENWNKMVQASVTSTALVVSNKAALDTFVKETYKKVKESRPQKGSKSYEGYYAGKQAGNKVNLTPSKKIDTNSNLKLS